MKPSAADCAVEYGRQEARAILRYRRESFLRSEFAVYGGFEMAVLVLKVLERAHPKH